MEYVSNALLYSSTFIYVDILSLQVDVETLGATCLLIALLTYLFSNTVLAILQRLNNICLVADESREVESFLSDLVLEGNTILSLKLSLSLRKTWEEGR